MATVFEQAAAVIAAAGTDAGGCDCTYRPAGGSPVTLKAKVSMVDVTDKRHGRGGIPVPTQRTVAIRLMVQRYQGGIDKVPLLGGSDYFDVPGHVVGKPAEATVRLKMVKPGTLVEGQYWTGELA